MAGRLAFGAVILFGIVATNEGAVVATSTDDGDKARMLKPPAHGTIPAAFLMSEGAVMIDFAGPWEAFREAMVPGRQDHPFHLYTVAETTKPIHASGGMQIVPDYTLANAPAPKVIVIPAQSEASAAALQWIRN